MRTRGATRTTRAIAVVLAFLGLAGPAWATQCASAISPIDLLRLGEIMIDGELITPVLPPAGNAEGSYIILRSPSGIHHHEWIPSTDSPMRVSLYRQDTFVSSYNRPLDRPSHEFLLEDGTYVALESVGCQSSGLEQTIIVVAPTGEQIWARKAESLLPAAYLTQLQQPSFGTAMGWMNAPALEIEGSGLADAKLIVRLSNYDKLEIGLRDAATRYVSIDDLGDDPAAWFLRARWFTFLRDDERSVEHYYRAFELDPENGPALDELIRIYERRDRDDLVEDVLQQAIVHRGVRDVAPDEVASTRFTTGQLSGHPVRIQRQLAALYARTGRQTEALATLDVTLSVFPNEWWTRIDQADLLIDATNRDAVRREIEDVYQYHMANVAASDEDPPNKSVLEKWYREAYGDWLAKHGFADAVDIDTLPLR